MLIFSKQERSLRRSRQRWQGHRRDTLAPEVPACANAPVAPTSTKTSNRLLRVVAAGEKPWRDTSTCAESSTAASAGSLVRRFAAVATAIKSDAPSSARRYRAPLTATADESPPCVQLIGRVAWPWLNWSFAINLAVESWRRYDCVVICGIHKLLIDAHVWDLIGTPAERKPPKLRAKRKHGCQLVRECIGIKIILVNSAPAKNVAPVDGKRER